MWSASLKLGQYQFEISLGAASSSAQDKPIRAEPSTLYGPKRKRIGFVTEARRRAYQHVKQSVSSEEK